MTERIEIAAMEPCFGAHRMSVADGAHRCRAA